MRITPLIDSNNGVFKGGRVLLRPGEEIGEHITKEREEVIVVLRGEATLLKEGKPILLRERDAYFIGNETAHNVRNNTREEVEYVYIVSQLNQN